jgi:hypothetical protein
VWKDSWHLGEEVCHHGAFDGVLEVGVVEDDDRRFAAELKGHVPDANSPYNSELFSSNLTTYGVAMLFLIFILKPSKTVRILFDR